jgi:mono/diheme cytochrome c family protein
MPRSMLRTFLLAGLLCLGWVASQTTTFPVMHALAGPAPAQGDAERGQAIFNGKGICYFCHGVDGRPDQRPELEEETASVVARLSPVAINLRNPKVLRLKSDEERFRAIREGHPGTGMLPDKTLTDQDLADTLAYLALLRREGDQKPGEPLAPHGKEQRP